MESKETGRETLDYLQGQLVPPTGFLQLGRNDAYQLLLLNNFDLIVTQFFVVILVLHPTTTKLHIMNLRPPCAYPNATSFRRLLGLLKHSDGNFIFFLYAPSTRLLPYPRDTYFYPRRPHYDKRSRTKYTEEGNKRRTLTSLLIFVIINYY